MCAAGFAPWYITSANALPNPKKKKMRLKTIAGGLALTTSVIRASIRAKTHRYTSRFPCLFILFLSRSFFFDVSGVDWYFFLLICTPLFQEGLIYRCELCPSSFCPEHLPSCASVIGVSELLAPLWRDGQPSDCKYVICSEQCKEFLEDNRNAKIFSDLQTSISPPACLPSSSPDSPLVPESPPPYNPSTHRSQTSISPPACQSASSPDSPFVPESPPPSNPSTRRFRRYEVQAIRLEKEGDPLNSSLFRVWWVGYKTSTVESYKHLAEDGLLETELDRVARKTVKAQRTIWGGASLRSGRDTSLASPLFERVASSLSEGQVIPTEIKLRFFKQGSRCVPYSFLNLVDASKKHLQKLMKKLDTERCSLSELCIPVRSVFGVTLVPVHENLDWFLNQTSGQFLLFDTIHCVGIDCQKQLIFDPSLKTALKLCKAAFDFCKIRQVEAARKIPPFNRKKKGGEEKEKQA